MFYRTLVTMLFTLFAATIVAPVYGQTVEAAGASTELQVNAPLQWLDDGKEIRIVRTTENAAVYFVGYYTASEISADRLAQFESNLLLSNIITLEPGTEQFEPLRIVRVTRAAAPDGECFGLLQIVHGENASQSDISVDEIALEIEAQLPRFPLDAACQEGNPPPLPPGFDTRHVLDGIGPIFLEPAQPCTSFPPLEVGQISLEPRMRVDFRRVIGGNEVPTRRVDLLDRYFDQFMRNLAMMLIRNDYGNPQILTYGNYDPRPHDLVIDMRLHEDGGEDTFCYIIDISQGEAVRRFSASVPREGRAFPWSDHPGGYFDPREFNRHFGEAVARSLMGQD